MIGTGRAAGRQVAVDFGAREFVDLEHETVYRAGPDSRRWDQGVPLADLADVVSYWRTGYNWRSFEA